MHIAISFPPGFTVEGIVLHAAGRTLRVAVRNWDDIAVFRVRNGRWTAENGDAVHLAPRHPLVPGAPSISAPYTDSTGLAGVSWHALPATAPAVCN